MYCCHLADNWIMITITNNLLRQISCNIQTLKYYYKFFIRTYQKAPIVQHYTYNTIKINNYIHISCTRIYKGERYITSTLIADIIGSINTYIID